MNLGGEVSAVTWILGEIILVGNAATGASLYETFVEISCGLGSDKGIAHKRYRLLGRRAVLGLAAIHFFRLNTDAHSLAMQGL